MGISLARKKKEERGRRGFLPTHEVTRGTLERGETHGKRLLSESILPHDACGVKIGN
jgi:hypothetical protein